MSWFTRDDKPGKPITREQILEKLQALWPGLVWGKTTCPGNVWFGDVDYLMPALEDVEYMVDTDLLNKVPYVKGAWDCDDFSAALAQHARTERRNEKPWPFFECWVTRLNGKDTVHAVNLALTVEGLYFIEPQRDTFRLASAEDDKPYFIR